MCVLYSISILSPSNDHFPLQCDPSHSPFLERWCLIIIIMYLFHDAKSLHCNTVPLLQESYLEPHVLSISLDASAVTSRKQKRALVYCSNNSSLRNKRNLFE